MAQQEGQKQQQSSCCRNKINNNKNHVQQERQQQGQLEHFVKSSTMPAHAPQVGATQTLWCLQRLPCLVLLGVAQRLSMEYMESLQLLKPGLLGQRPLVVITRDPQKVGACVAPPLFFFARLSSSLRRSIRVTATVQYEWLQPLTTSGYAAATSTRRTQLGAEQL